MQLQVARTHICGDAQATARAVLKRQDYAPLFLPSIQILTHS